MQRQNAIGTNQYRTRPQTPSPPLIAPQNALINLTTVTTPSDTPSHAHTIPVVGWELHYKTGTSNKVYRIIQHRDTVVLAWGRVGAAGQRQILTDHSKINLNTLIHKKLSEKTDKGYIVRRPPAKRWLDLSTWLAIVSTDNVACKRALSNLGQFFEAPPEELLPSSQASLAASELESPTFLKVAQALAE